MLNYLKIITKKISSNAEKNLYALVENSLGLYTCVYDNDDRMDDRLK